MSRLALAGLVVRADGHVLLDVPALEVAAGEILVVLGPTGAGKSTLLRVMGLLQRPAAGTLRWDGAAVSWPPPLALRRRLAMVFQAPLLFSGTVFDNVAYGLRLRGTDGVALRGRVTSALEQFHVAPLVARRVATLSGGEAQRVALARAVVLEPELLLLDEPLASLDAPIREHLRDELRQVIRRHGMTCVHVTHDLAEAFALADRIAVLAGGRLLAAGSPAEICHGADRPAVAEFLRAGGLLPAEIVTAAEGVLTVRLAGREMTLGPGARVGVPLGGAETDLLRGGEPGNMAP